MNLSTSFQERIEEVISNIELENQVDNTILKNRFLYEVMLYEKKRDDNKSYCNKFRFIVTTGSILLPAILSIGQMDPNKLPSYFEDITYWASWTISLAVTISNGFLQLFSIDKQYFTYSIITEQLKTEGWQFVQLSGKYEHFKTHVEAYKTFCKSIESIKRKQIEQEFSSGKVDKKTSKKYEESISEFKDQSISNSHKLTNIIVDTVNQSKEKVLDNIQLSIDKKEDKSINEVQKK